MQRLGDQLREAWAPWREAIAGLSDNPLPRYFRLIEQRRRERAHWRTSVLIYFVAILAIVNFGVSVAVTLIFDTSSDWTNSEWTTAAIALAVILALDFAILNAIRRSAVWRRYLLPAFLALLAATLLLFALLTGVRLDEIDLTMLAVFAMFVVVPVFAIWLLTGIYTSFSRCLNLLVVFPRGQQQQALDEGMLLSSLTPQEFVAGTLSTVALPLLLRIAAGSALGCALLVNYYSYGVWLTRSASLQPENLQMLRLLPVTFACVLLAGILGALLLCLLLIVFGRQIRSSYFAASAAFLWVLYQGAFVYVGVVSLDLICGNWERRGFSLAVQHDADLTEPASVCAALLAGVSPSLAGRAVIAGLVIGLVVWWWMRRPSAAFRTGGLAAVLMMLLQLAAAPGFREYIQRVASRGLGLNTQLAIEIVTVAGAAIYMLLPRCRRRPWLTLASAVIACLAVSILIQQAIDNTWPVVSGLSTLAESLVLNAPGFLLMMAGLVFLSLRSRQTGEVLASGLPVLLAGCCFGILMFMPSPDGLYSTKSEYRPYTAPWGAGVAAFFNPLAVPSSLCIGEPLLSDLLSKPPAETVAVYDPDQRYATYAKQRDQWRIERADKWQRALYTPLLEWWRFPTLIGLQLLLIACFAALAVRAVELRRLNE